MYIKLDVKNLAKWIALLKEIPRKARPIALKAFAEYLRAVLTLKSYPSYQYVSRKTAYGYTFKSAAQRRWFWANGGPNMIGNHRTGRLGNGWQIQGSPQGAYHIVNNVPYAGYVMGAGQARQPALVGWPKVWDLIQNNVKGAIQAAQAAVYAWINGQ